MQIKSDTTTAKAAYQDFLALWKDADPDIPVFVAAKSELSTFPVRAALIRTWCQNSEFCVRFTALHST
jgi:hypothetical protein